MSIDVTIKQKGLFKKAIPLEVILSDNLNFGSYDNAWRLKPGEFDGNEIIVYNPKKIGRGFSITWTLEEKDIVVLRALTPSTANELRDFFDVIKRITDYWKCELTVDDTRMTPNEFQNIYDNILDFDRKALKHLVDDILSGKRSTTTLFSAMYPLNLGVMEAKQFENNIELYDLWLHEKQKDDLYYAVPGFFYDSDESIVGRYALTEGVTSIFPIEPYVPFGTIDPNTNTQLECNNFVVALGSTTNNEIIGYISYDNLLKGIDDSKISSFDSRHVIIDALSLEDLKKLSEE